MRKCVADPVQSVTDGQSFSGWGFVIYDDVGKPRLTLSHAEETDAEAGHVQVAGALVKAVVTET
jgi:formylmethanofuran dehydrogenase subunit E